MPKRPAKSLIWSFLLTLLAIPPGTAWAQSKDQELFLEKIKTISTVDDAKITGDYLVVWPSPDVQGALDYELMGSKMCEEYRSYGYLAVSFMDSSLYRREKEVSLLQSVICFSADR